MIHAVLHGKSQNIEYSEDMLTSTVFGMLRYLPLGDGLIPFIEDSFLYDKCRTPLWEVFKGVGIELRCYQRVQFKFWSRHSILGEPDLILLFTDHVHREEDLLLIIEAKFKSPKSGTDEYDQLMRYYNAVEKKIDWFLDEELSNFRGKKGYIIYVTESEAASEIEESIKCIKNIDEDFKDKIFHLRWHQLHRIITDKLDTYSNIEKVIAIDLIRYLERLGLKEFSGISDPEERIMQTINRKGSIFFNNATYFNKLPKVKINNEGYCFYNMVNR